MINYDAAFKEQGGKCAICGKEWEPVTKQGKKARKMHRDHNHEKLYPRGLLCYLCNVRLRGEITSAWCLAAAKYLKKYEDIHEGE